MHHRWVSLYREHARAAFSLGLIFVVAALELRPSLNWVCILDHFFRFQNVINLNHRKLYKFNFYWLEISKHWKNLFWILVRFRIEDSLIIVIEVWTLELNVFHSGYIFSFIHLKLILFKCVIVSIFSTSVIFDIYPVHSKRYTAKRNPAPAFDPKVFLISVRTRNQTLQTNARIWATKGLKIIWNYSEVIEQSARTLQMRTLLTA